MADLTPVLAFVFRAEGGYVNDSRDPGRATNLGITLATLSDWRGHPCSSDDVHDLTRAEATAIYMARYANPVRAHDLPAGVDLMVLDEGVNTGTVPAARMLQTLAHVPSDGWIGPATLAAVAKLAPGPLIVALAVAQSDYYRGLAGFPTFGRGWLARVTARRAAALSLSAGHGAVPSLTVTATRVTAPTGDDGTAALNDAEAAQVG